jgi:hypothetical protein
MSPATITTDHEVSETIDQALNELRRKLALEQVLESLRGWLAYERFKREEWFGVDDREMYAYHRGYERGLERGIATIEGMLQAADSEMA